MESLSARMCFSDGSKTEKAMVFTHKPRMRLLSDSLPSVRNFEMTSTLLRERDSSSPNPCGRRIMCRAGKGGCSRPSGPAAFHEGAKDVVQVAFEAGEIVRVWVVDREQLCIVEWVSPPYVSFVVVHSWCGEECLTPRG
jgi:hypothetical protein